MACSTVSLLWSLPTLRFLSSEKPTPTCYGLPPHNHFVKHFSYATNLNRNSKFRTPQAVLDTSPITPTPLTTSTLRELCQAHVPQHILQRQFQDLSPFFFLSLFPALLCAKNLKNVIQDGRDWICNAHRYPEGSFALPFFRAWLHSSCSGYLYFTPFIAFWSMFMCRLIFISSLDRFWEDTHIPAFDSLPHQCCKILCASPSCCAHPGTRNASKNIFELWRHSSMLLIFTTTCKG